MQLNRVWVADITYLPLKCGGFAYLASLMDLCSRRVVGWSLDVQMTDALVIDALQKAIAKRQPPPGLFITAIAADNTPATTIAPSSAELTAGKA